jgi:acyl-coenzyme A thioesterase PaaI-like protein
MTDKTDFAVPEGWTPIDPFPRLATSGAFVSRDFEGERFRVRYYHRASDDTLVATVWFGPGTEGPPGHAHGGSVAAVLDEAMGAAVWHSGHPVVAAQLTVNFREMVPVNLHGVVEATIERIEGRKISARGRLLSPDGTVLADARGLFIVLQDEQLARLAAQMR